MGRDNGTFKRAYGMKVLTVDEDRLNVRLYFPAKNDQMKYVNLSLGAKDLYRIGLKLDKTFEVNPGDWLAYDFDKFVSLVGKRRSLNGNAKKNGGTVVSENAEDIDDLIGDALRGSGSGLLKSPEDSDGLLNDSGRSGSGWDLESVMDE